MTAKRPKRKQPAQPAKPAPAKPAPAKPADDDDDDTSLVEHAAIAVAIAATSITTFWSAARAVRWLQRKMEGKGEDIRLLSSP